MRASNVHEPSEHANSNGRRLSLVLWLVVAYMAAEIAGGFLAHSLALLADAAHMLLDAVALGLALFAIRMARMKATSRHTYGFYRVEILAALVNSVSLVGIALFIFVEAWQRLQDPPDVLGTWMSAVAAGGLAVNLVSLRILHADHNANLNVRAARLHVWMDTLGSTGAILAGLLIWAFHWDWADPAIAIVIGILIIRSVWALLLESVTVLMESAPGNIDVDQIRSALLQVPGVASVHDLHVWTITSGMTALSAHAVPSGDANHGQILQAIESEMHRFGIGHSTIQIEPESHRHIGTHGEDCRALKSPPKGIHISGP